MKSATMDRPPSEAKQADATEEVAPDVNQELAQSDAPAADENAAGAPPDESVSDPVPAEPPAPVEPAKPLSELEAEHYREVTRINNDVREARAEWLNLKQETSDAKKRFDGLNSELSLLITRGPGYQRKLPGMSESSATDAQSASAGDSAATVADEPVNDEWRKVSVDELKLGPHITGLLDTNHLNTLGDLDDFWKSGKVLTDLKGIGGEKADRVADAFADYGAQHPEVFRGTVAPDPAKADEAPADELPATDDEAAD